MTHPILALDGVSLYLPDGRALFSNLNHQFDLRRTGLVGRNGVGKSMLARLLAGELAPTTGQCLRSARVAYLSQQAGSGQAASVAELAGIAAITDALARIEAGNVDPRDFDAVGEHWDIAARLRQACQAQGLAHVGLDTPVASLSGGEAMRVALLGATLFDPDFLILDEPSNHLDAAGRAALLSQLQAWPKGLLVISHDRELLDAMERIVELSGDGLRSYGGNYTFYEQAGARSRKRRRARSITRARSSGATRQRGAPSANGMTGARRAATLTRKTPTRPRSCSAAARTAAKAAPGACASSTTTRAPGRSRGCAMPRSGSRATPPCASTRQASTAQPSAVWRNSMVSCSPGWWRP